MFEFINHSEFWFGLFFGFTPVIAGYLLLFVACRDAVLTKCEACNATISVLAVQHVEAGKEVRKVCERCFLKLAFERVFEDELGPSRWRLKCQS